MPSLAGCLCCAVLCSPFPTCSVLPRLQPPLKYGSGSLLTPRTGWTLDPVLQFRDLNQWKASPGLSFPTGNMEGGCGSGMLSR